DLLVVRRLDLARVEDQRTPLVTLGDVHAVHLEKRAHHGDIADLGDVAQDAGALPQEGGHHRLGGEVLRALHIDAAAQRTASADREHGTGGNRNLVDVSVAERCRHSGLFYSGQARRWPRVSHPITAGAAGACDPGPTARPLLSGWGVCGAATTRGGPRTARSCLRCAV